MAQVILYNPKEKARLKVPYVPFSLMTVASSMKVSGVSFSLIDSRVDTDAHEQVLKGLENPEVVMFGLTLMTGSVIYDVLEVARMVRRKRPDVKIVFGGVHATMLPEETAQHDLVDIVISGAGEETAVELAQKLINKENWKEVAGLVFEEDGKIITTPPRQKANEALYSGIDYDIVDLTKYVKKDATGERCLDYLSSRGCPHPCTYCAIAEVWGKKMLYYPPDQMVNNLMYLQQKLNLDSIHFLDDNFFVRRSRVEEFCDNVIASGLKLKFWAMCRIQYFWQYDDAFLAKLKQAGFATINFGAESGSEVVLQKLKKTHTPEQILMTARKCNEFGIRAQFSFMMALPYETPQDLELTMSMIDQIHKINPVFDMQLFPFTPFPKTELAAESAAYGFVQPKTLEEWARFEYGNIKMPWLSPLMRRRVDTLTTLAWFAFTSETAIKLGKLYGTAFRFFGSVARLRWSFRFFDHAYEWKMVNAFAKSC